MRSTRASIRWSSSAPFDAEPDLDGGAARVVAGQGGAERAAGQLDHLKRADDPAAVARQDRGRRGGVGRLQPLVKRAPGPCAASSRLEPLA